MQYIKDLTNYYFPSLFMIELPPNMKNRDIKYIFKKSCYSRNNEKAKHIFITYKTKTNLNLFRTTIANIIHKNDNKDLINFFVINYDLIDLLNIVQIFHDPVNIYEILIFNDLCGIKFIENIFYHSINKKYFKTCLSLIANKQEILNNDSLIHHCYSQIINRNNIDGIFMLNKYYPLEKYFNGNRKMLTDAAIKTMMSSRPIIKLLNENFDDVLTPKNIDKMFYAAVNTNSAVIFLNIFLQSTIDPFENFNYFYYACNTNSYAIVSQYISKINIKNIATKHINYDLIISKNWKRTYLLLVCNSISPQDKKIKIIAHKKFKNKNCENKDNCNCTCVMESMNYGNKKTDF